MEQLVDLDIIFEDASVVVCRKPAGIPVQTAGFGQSDMESLLRNRRVKRQESSELYVVHRLDQPVEGIIVFAKDKKSASSLGRQLQNGQMDKRYLAILEGEPPVQYGRVEDWLIKDAKSRTARVVQAGTPGAKLAALSYRVLETAGGQALTEIELETGRYHQIRVQMSHLGCPLAGDKKYNKNCGTEYLPIGLCSVHLGFRHPVHGKNMEYTLNPVGPAFQAFHKKK